MKIIMWIAIGVVTLIVMAYLYVKWKSSVWSDSSLRFNMEYPNKGIKVACVGDSLTQGSGSGNIKKYSYPARLSKLLGDDFIVGNFGVNGSSAINEEGSSYSRKKAYEYSQKFGADIVLMMLGTNDSVIGMWNKESYKKDYKALIETYIDMPNPPSVFVITPIPAYSDKYNLQADVIQNEIIPEIRSLSAELCIDYIDLNSSFKDKHDCYIFDKIHLNKKGYGLIAKVLFDVIMWDKFL